VPTYPHPFHYQLSHLHATIIGFFTAADTITTTGTERMRIDSSGNVGIGTTSPTGLFSIEQGSTGPVMFVGDQGTSTPHFVIDGKGNVGIGTTSPSDALHIWRNASGNTTVKITNLATGNSTARLTLEGPTSSGGFIAYASDFYDSDFADKLAIMSDGGASGFVVVARSGDIQFNAPINTERVTIKGDSGNVGIGTTTPTTQFQATNSTANATTTIEFGKVNQNKGSCIILYDSSGTAYYCSVEGGTFTCDTTSCE